MNKALLLILLGFVSFSTYSQNLFSQSFEGCNTDKFGIEHTNISLYPKSNLVNFIQEYIDSDIKNEIQGVLVLQIIVDMEGNSCLMSIENESNVKSEFSKLKKATDELLKWEIPVEKKSAIIVIKFSEIVEIKRFGLKDDLGFHELEK